MFSGSTTPTPGEHRVFKVVVFVLVLAACLAPPSGEEAGVDPDLRRAAAGRRRPSPQTMQSLALLEGRLVRGVRAVQGADRMQGRAA